MTQGHRETFLGHLVCHGTLSKTMSSMEESGTEDWGALVTQQVGDAYQLSGATDSIFGSSDICQGEEKHT